MTTYWYVDGMMSPYWYCTVEEDYPAEGKSTYVWHNRDADTDMGDLYDSEFTTAFPWAKQISETEFNETTP